MSRREPRATRRVGGPSLDPPYPRVRPFQVIHLRNGSIVQPQGLDGGYRDPVPLVRLHLHEAGILEFAEGSGEMEGAAPLCLASSAIDLGFLSRMIAISLRFSGVSRRTSTSTEIKLGRAASLGAAFSPRATARISRSTRGGSDFLDQLFRMARKTLRTSSATPRSASTRRTSAKKSAMSLSALSKRYGRPLSPSMRCR